MSHSEWEPDFSNFAINSASNFVSIFSEFESESDGSESGFNSVFINLDFFLPYIYNLLNKLADDFFINMHSRINSYVSDASLMHKSITKSTFFYYFNWCFIWAAIHIYNTLLSYVTELINFFNALFLLIPINEHIKVAPFALSIAIFFKE